MHSEISWLLIIRAVVVAGLSWFVLGWLVKVTGWWVGGK